MGRETGAADGVVQGQVSREEGGRAMSNVALHPEFFVMLAGILSGGIGASLFLLQLFHGALSQRKTGPARRFKKSRRVFLEEWAR